MKTRLIALLLFGAVYVALGDEKLYSFDEYCAALSAHNEHVSGTGERPWEPFGAYSAIVAAEDRGAGTRRAIQTVPPPVLHDFIHWVNAIVRPEAIPPELEQRITAIPDVQIFISKDAEGNCICRWTSDILLWENSSAADWQVWDSGSFFCCLIRDREHRESTEESARKYVEKMLVTFFNFTAEDLAKGKLSLTKTEPFRVGHFEQPDRKPENWKNRFDFVIGSDFILFIFWEIEPGQSERANPGDIDRF